MKRFEHQWADFKWVDLEGPSQQDFLNIASEFEIPLHPLANSLDPEHLPHAEFFGTTAFFILRNYDNLAKDSAFSMQALTTKIVFAVGTDFILTIHRGTIDTIEDRKTKCPFEQMSKTDFLQHVIRGVILSFDRPIEDLETKTEIIEGRVFALRRRNILREGYNVKRKASTYRKIFKFTLDLLIKLKLRTEVPIDDVTEIREPLDRMIFYTDNIYEEITGLLNLHLSLMSQKTNEASFKTNEIMRILTVVSIFFLPLNFIAGVYGMNFEHMPELKHENAYFVILGVMLLISMIILSWIYRKGWLRKEDL